MEGGVMLICSESRSLAVRLRRIYALQQPFSGVQEASLLGLPYFVSSGDQSQCS